MKPTVVITTRNRKDSLRTALQSVVTQTAQPEVLVIDDASTDGTAEMVRTEFPSVRLDLSPQSRGYIVHRNRGAHLTDSDIIFSVDDDAAFSTPHVIEQTLAEFDHDRVGAVAIPFINVNKENVLLQRAPGNTGIFACHSYIGTAHALRRELFIKLGGYREYLFHQGEEQDYCMRMLEAGYIVRLGRSDVIHHFESPRRDFRRMDLYGQRNQLLYVWYNVPWPDFPVHLIATSAKGLSHGLRVRRFWTALQGQAKGVGSIVHEWSQRRPASRQVYRLSRLVKRRPQLLEEIENALSPLIDYTSVGRT
jgi:glycosyltransferase involved in cell wall biosynthesis